MDRDVFFHLYEYFNESGRVVDSLITTDSDDPNYDASLADESLEEKLLDAVKDNRFGRPRSDGGTFGETSPHDAALGLLAIVGVLMDEKISLDKVRSISAVAANRMKAVPVSAVLPDIENLLDIQEARAVRALFRSPTVP